MGYVRHFLAAFLVLLAASCQPAFAAAAAAATCETVPKSKIDEGIAIARSGLYPQLQVLTGRNAKKFATSIGVSGDVIAIGLVETGLLPLMFFDQERYSEHMLVTAFRRGAAFVICYDQADEDTVALFRRHVEAAT